MTIVELLGQLRQANIQLSLDGDKLKIKAPQGALTDVLKEQLRERKEEIIAFLKGASETSALPFPRVDRAGAMPLSYTQQGLWFVEQLMPGTAAYTMPVGFKVRGRLDIGALQTALNQVVARHETLRTRFMATAEGTPQAIIDPLLTITLAQDTVVCNETECDLHIRTLLANAALSVFDLERGPLLKMSVISFRQPDGSGDLYLIVGAIHHIISDGWSQGLLVKELLAAYVSASTGFPIPLPELPVQYVDFAAWQHEYLKTDAYARKLDYWLQHLRHIPVQLVFPTDHERPAVQTTRGSNYHFTLDDALAARFLDFCLARDITPFMGLMAIWQVILARSAQQFDFCVGIPTAGRQHAALEPIIGFFVDPLVVRSSTRSDLSFDELLGDVRQELLNAFDRQDVPLAQIIDRLNVPRNPAYAPVAQVGFQLQNFAGVMAQGDAQKAMLTQIQAMTRMSVEMLDIEEVASKFDMILTWVQDDRRLRGTLEYNRDLFEPATIARIMRQFQHVMTQMMEDPALVIDRIALIPDEELYDILGVDRAHFELRPLSPMQRDMYVDTLMDPATLKNSIGYHALTHGRFDVDTWIRAAHHLAGHQTLLRASIQPSDVPWLDIAYLKIARQPSLHIHVLDWSDRTLSDQEARTLAHEFSLKPYDIHGNHLIEQHVISLSGGRHLLVFSVNHLLFDGAGMFHHLEDQIKVAEALSRGETLPLFEDRFHEFVSQSRRETDTASTLRFWRSLTSTVEALDFSLPPSTRDRVRHPERIEKSLAIDPAHWTAVQSVSRQMGFHPAFYFKMLYALVIQSYCRAEADFAVAEVVSGRSAQQRGMFGNYFQIQPTVFPRTLFDSCSAIEDLAMHVRHYRKSLREVGPLSLLMQSRILPQGRLAFMFNYYNFIASYRLWDADLASSAHSQQQDGPVQLLVKEQDGGIELVLIHQSDLFDDLRFLERLVYASEQVLSGRRHIGEIDLVLPDERPLWQAHCHGPVWSLPAGETIVDQFARSVAQYPDRIAVVAGDMRLTYRELDEDSNRLARWLGPVRGQRIAVCQDRSIDLIVSLVAILKSGAAYVPMDSQYPAERLAFILEDSAAPVLLTQRCVHERLHTEGIDLGQRRTVLVDDPHWRQASASPLDSRPVPDDLIYVIYTSGSTGKPKGAAVYHRGEVNLLRWYRDVLSLDENSVFLLMSATGFDLTQKNVWGPLSAGATIVLPTSDSYDPQHLADLVGRECVTVINCAPSAFYPIVEQQQHPDYPFASLRSVVLGGEPIRLSALDAWRNDPRMEVDLINSYGPTECSDVVASFTLRSREQAPFGLLPIGRPVTNTELRIVSDSGVALPAGLVGELWIAGEGVGAGYLGRPDLNETAFVVDADGRRWYRTGDLVRQWPSGDIEYIGRKDFQIKLRGLRIELGEIEAALKDQVGVDDSLLMVIDDQLVAYVVSRADVSAPALSMALRQRLPEYMVPAHIVFLETWPLTPNGKIDRKALPAPAATAATDIVLPRTPVEDKIAAIWREVLKRDAVSIHDNFFALGGHSLLATQIVSRLRKSMDVTLSLREFLSASTIAQLADVIERAQSSSDAFPVDRIDRNMRIPLSYAQQRLWLLDQIDPGNIAYNVPMALHIRGALDTEAFVTAISATVNRHEALRTRFLVDDEGPYQQIEPVQHWHTERIDLDPSESHDTQSLLRRVTTAIARSFRLDEGPLFRSVLIRVTASHHVHVFVAHHSVTDGWSMGVVVQDVVLSYLSLAKGVPLQMSPLPLQFADVAVWQRRCLQEDLRQRKQAYWRSTLADVPALSMPTDRPRPAVQTFNGQELGFVIGMDASRRIRDLALALDTTCFNVLMSLFAGILARYSGQDDFAIGTPVAGRDRVEFESIVGFFVNTVALRVNPESHKTLSSLVSEVSDHGRRAFEHQDIPFEEVVDLVDPVRDMSRSPVFQVMMVLQNIPLGSHRLEGMLSRVDDIAVAPFASPFDVAKFDLTLTLADVADQFDASLQFNTDLFDRQTMEQFVARFTQLINGWTESPDKALHDIDVLSAAERKLLVHDWNQTFTPAPAWRTVQEGFAGAVEAHANRVAVRCGPQALTYTDLDKASTRLAAYLQLKGVCRGDRVGLCFDRSIHLMTALLGIIKAGATYVPVDAAYPAGRIAHMVRASGMHLVLTRAHVSLNLPEDVQAVDVDVVLSSSDVLSFQPVVAEPDDLFYIIFTSGSTGVPKGAAVYQKGEVNLLNWYINRFSMSTSDRVLLMSAIGFDLTQKNLWAPLLCGAQLVIPDFQEYDPEALGGLCITYGVTWVNCAPSAFYPLVEDAESQRFPDLRWVFLGGEPVNLSRLASWYRRADAWLVNSYGPTECTDISSFYIVPRDLPATGRVPIGRPNDNVQLYVLGAHHELLPAGVTGELWVAGEGVGAGYVGDPVLTDAVFVANPFGNGKMYRTGDRVRYLANGDIDYLGRIDHQIKLRGYRIEVSEIQAVINAVDGVVDSYVAVTGEGAGQRLVAWVVTPGNHDRWIDRVRFAVVHHLPVFMHPAGYVRLDAFPLTPNGKIDRKSLPMPAEEKTVLRLPETPLERDVAVIWMSVLGVESIGLEHDFFELGGNSLLATTIVSRINRQFSSHISVRTLFDHSLFGDFCDQVAGAARGVRLPTLSAGSLDGDLPLSYGQSRLWYFEQLNPGTAINNMPGALLVQGEIDIVGIRFAVGELMRRHAVLRASFHLSASQEPVMRVAPTVPVPVSEDVVRVEVSQQRAFIQQRLQQFASTPFDLTQPGLLRLHIIRFEGDVPLAAIVFCMHHIASDGVSLQVMMNELLTHYSGVVSGRPRPVPDLRIQYPDFSRWQRGWLESGGLESQISVWLDRLAGVPDVNTFPPDRQRPPVQSTHGATYKLSLPETLVQSLEMQSRARRVTPFVMVLCAWQALMSRYLQRDDVAVGVPTSGRTHPDLEPMIGFFINSVIIRSRWPRNATLEQVLEAVKQSSLDAFAHGDVPLDLLLQRLPVKRNVSHTPIVQTAFQLFSDARTKGTDGPGLPGGQVEFVHAERKTANFDMTVSLHHTAGRLAAEFEYNTDLFEAESVSRIADQFVAVLDCLLERPHTPLLRVPLVNDQHTLMARLALSGDEYERVLPLTHMQHDMFLDNIMHPQSLQSSHGFVHHLSKPLDLDIWQAAIDSYTRDFALARSRVVLVSAPDLEVAYLAVRRHHRNRLETEDLQGVFTTREAVDDHLRPFIYRRYDLARDELLRFRYVRVSDTHHVVAASIHHAILDGMGLEHLWRDLIRRYETLKAGGTPEPITDRFEEHILEDRMTKDTASIRRFWQDALATVEPLDFTVPPPVPSPGRAITRQVVLDERHNDAIKAYCRAHKITPAIYFKGVYAIAIQLFCRPDGDFCLQETHSGRPASHADQAGCYIQEIPFVVPRTLFEEQAPVAALWEHARQFQKRTKEYRLISLGLQHELAPKGRTAFMYNFYQFVPSRYEIDGDVIDSPEAASSDPANNVQLIVKGVGGRQTLNLYYHPHLFADLGFLDVIVDISRQIVEDGVDRIAGLCWVRTDSPAQQQLLAWNATAAAFDLSHPIHERFRLQVSRTPDALAIVDDHLSLSYRDLDGRSDALASCLQSSGVEEGDLVGLCAERSCHFLVGILGIMKAGGAYVPMDAHYPAERIAYMQENSEARVIVTESALLAKISRREGVTALCLDRDWPAISLSPPPRPLCRTTPASVAYMLYTSGSTGLPKGALIRHDGALNHIEAERQVLGFDAGFNFLQTAPASSDISVWQFLGPVTCGGTVVVLDDVTQAAKMFSLVNRYAVNVVELVPVAWQLLMDHVMSLAPGVRGMPSLRWLMATGEAVPVPMVNQWLALYPDIPVVNAYGPTEAADDVIQNTIREPLPDHVRSVPIGRPLANLNALIVDAGLRLVPPGVPGEICISGIGVGNGYWKNPEKTTAAFVPNCHEGYLGAMLYRTGDVGRWLADGTIEYLDRVDNQVKIRGFRIELGEVEAVLAAQPEVAEAAVIVRHDLPGGAALVGYFVSRHTNVDVMSVRTAMRQRLPEYMVPAVLVQLARFPTTPAGKIDRKGLPAPELLEDSHYIAPTNDTEVRLQTLFSAVLGRERISCDQAFFDAGGNSLMAVRLITRINEAFGTELLVADLLRHTSVSLMAARIEAGNGSCSNMLVSLRDPQSDIPADHDPARSLSAPAEGVTWVFVHPVGGDVLCYQELVRELPLQDRVVGLRNTGLDPQGELLADPAVWLMRASSALQGLPPSRIVLVGQSLGGVLALALAARLSRQGMDVARLVLVDSFVPSEMILRPDESLARAMGMPLPESIVSGLDFSSDAWIDSVFAFASKAGLVPADLSLAQVRRIYRVARANESMVQTLTLPVIAAFPVLHVRAAQNPEDSAAGWKRGACPFSFVSLEGDHESVLRGANARALAQALVAFATQA